LCHVLLIFFPWNTTNALSGVIVVGNENYFILNSILY